MSTKRIPVYEDTTVDGVTEKSLAGYETVSEPDPPKDVKATVKKAMFRIAVVFTALAMAVSAAAIGHLFSQVIPPYVAYPAAGLFDALWIYALMGEYLSQTRPKPRKAAQAAGIVFVAASMAAIVLEAQSLGYVLVGAVMALVPAAVKGGWWLWFEITSYRLPVAYQNRLEKERSRVHTELAVEEEQRELDAAQALTRELREHRLMAQRADDYRITQVTGADLDEVTEKVSELVSGSAAQLKAQRMAQLTELVSREPELTPSQVMSELDVSLATAKRYLKEVRS